MRAICVMGFVACVGVPSLVSAMELGVALKAGSLGMGVEAATAVGEKLNVRAGLNTASLTYNGTESGNEFEFDLTLSSIAAMADWYVFDGGFRVSSGLVLNNNGLDATAEAELGEYEIGGRIYRPEEVGVFRGEIEFSSLAPYFGIGWGNMVGWDKTLGLVVDLGFMYQGSPSVSLWTDETLPEATAQRTLEENLRQEESELEDAIEEFAVYPVISVGLSYKF